MELKNRVVKGVLWTVAERGGSMLVQVAVSLVLARLLTPADFGLVGMLAVFAMISIIFVDGGFTQSLIRKEQPTPEDYSSVFYLNLLAGVVMYGLLCALVWPIASFYGQPQLIRIAPAAFLSVPIVALFTVQQTVFMKRMDFRTLARISLVSVVISGGIALWMAFAGWGVWALVWQPVIHGIVRGILLWTWSPWRPERRFSKTSIRSLAGFGSRVFLASLINQVFNSLMHMFVGRIYGAAQFGLYDQSRKLKELPSEALAASVMNVTFPALSSIQGDAGKLRAGSRKVIIVMAFVLFPVMVGLMATAPQFFPVILTDKWSGAIPYFQIFCLTALVLPTQTVMQNVIKVCGHSRAVLHAELIRKAFALAVVAVTLPISIGAVIWGQVVYLAFAMGVGMWYGRKLIGYGAGAQLRDLMPVALLTAVMGAGVWAAGQFASGMLTLGWLLLFKIGTGALIYVAGASLFRLEAWQDTREILRNLIRRPK